MLGNTSKILGNLQPIPLTIINPKVYDSTYDIYNKILLDNAKSVIGGIINYGLDSIFPNNLFGNVGKFVSSTLINTVLGANNINEDNLDYYRFRINPNRLVKRRKKIVTQKYTGNGWDVDTRGEEMIAYSYSGSSGSLINDNLGNQLMSTLLEYIKSSTFGSYLDTFLNYVIYNPKLSSAYLKMVLFETFWKTNNDDLLIVFEDNTYLGKFQSFEWNQDAMNPYQINYNFDFMVYPQFNYNTNSGWVTLEDEKKMRKRFKSIVTVPLKDSNVSIQPKMYSLTSDYVITENEIIFDVNSTNIIFEVKRRIDMAKFYNVKPIGASQAIEEENINVGKLSIYDETESFIDATLLAQNIIWLDGKLINAKLALSSLQQRIQDKLSTNIISSKSLALEAGNTLKMNKDGARLKSALSGNQIENIDNITPQDLATKYTKLSGIDIFEDAINFNLKKNKNTDNINKSNPNNIINSGGMASNKIKF